MVVTTTYHLFNENETPNHLISEIAKHVMAFSTFFFLDERENKMYGE